MDTENSSLRLENLKKVFLLKTMGWFGNMILLSMVDGSSMLSSPFLLTTLFQLSSYLPGQHLTEPSPSVVSSSNLTTIDDPYPQPSKHWRKRKRGKLQKQKQIIEKKGQMILILETLGKPIWVHGNVDYTLIHWLYRKSMMDLLDILMKNVITFTCIQPKWPRQRLIINPQPKITG